MPFLTPGCWVQTEHDSVQCQCARTLLKRKEGIRQFSESANFELLGKILPRTEISMDIFKRRKLTTDAKGSYINFISLLENSVLEFKTQVAWDALLL